MSLPKCAVIGCNNLVDPRWYCHGWDDGKPVRICDGHDTCATTGNTDEDNCVCPDTMPDDVSFLRDLSEKLRHVPVMYGIDDFYIDHLRTIAKNIEDQEKGS